MLDWLTLCRGVDMFRFVGGVVAVVNRDCSTFLNSEFSSVLDINECLKNNGGCHSKRKCINTEGSRTCGGCPTGWVNDGAAGCKGRFFRADIKRQFPMVACSTILNRPPAQI